MNISNQVDVEHVVPKSLEPGLVHDWHNFLLACKSCNIIKSNHNESREGYLFPDTHNTAHAFAYTQTQVKVNDVLNQQDQEQAKATLQLVNLNREKDSNGRLDDRSFARMREWDKALESLRDYLQLQQEPMVRQIARSPSGFISSWLEVFKDYPDVKKALLEAMPGTCMECYNENLEPKQTVSRNA